MKKSFFKIGLMALCVGFIGWTGCQTKSKPISHKVVLQSMKFVPDTVYAHVGDTIFFENKGIVNHNITADDSSMASPDFAPNNSWHWIVKKTLNYHCSIHPVMKGHIIVKE